MNKAIFLDRDGVINDNVNNLVEPSQFKMLPGASEAIKKINDSGYLVVLITNQPVIAKGFCTFEGMNKIHEKMNDFLAEKGARLDKVYICPHHPKKGFPGEVPELKIDCDCRKPKSGLFLKAIKELDIDAVQSWSIGDSHGDTEAAKKVGIKTIFLTSGGGAGSKQEKELGYVKSDYVKYDLLEAVEFILSKEKIN